MRWSLFSTVIPKPPPVRAGFVPILARGGPCRGWAEVRRIQSLYIFIYLCVERSRTTSTIREAQTAFLGISRSFRRSGPFRAGQRPVRPSGPALILEDVAGVAPHRRSAVGGGAVAGATPPYQQKSGRRARLGQRPPMREEIETAVMVTRSAAACYAPPW